MIRICLRTAGAVLSVCCGLLVALPWHTALAAPVVFQKASDNGTHDDADRFSATLGQGGSGSQAFLQLLTAPGPGARITGFYVQDTTGAVARDAISGGPLVRLSPTTVYEVVLADPGANKLRVIKALTDALGISLSQAKALADNAPSVIRSSDTPDGNATLQQALQSAGATITLDTRQAPGVPVGANVGVTMPGAAPTGYDIVLDTVGGNKVAVIKVVRDLTGLSLTESKQLVDNAPSVLRTNASRDDAAAARLALKDAGATVQLAPVGGTPGQAIALPPGSMGITPDFGFGFAYTDVLATPTLQLTLELDTPFADLLDAWQDGRFLLGLRVTDSAGLSDLYVAANDGAPATVPEPPTVALVALAMLGLLRGRRGRWPARRMVGQPSAVRPCAARAA